MSPTIALFGGSFNPPGVHHRVIAMQLAKQFDRVQVIPCGPRPDKATTNDLSALDRAIMADMTFGNIPKCEVELFDLEQATFTTTLKLLKDYSTRGETWIVVGADLIQGGKNSAIYAQWEGGKALWEEARFAIIPMTQYPLSSSDLPPHYRIIDVSHGGFSSTRIRQSVFSGEDFSDLVVSPVREYIERYRLYRRTLSVRMTKANFSPDMPVMLHVDERNPKAIAMSQYFTSVSSVDEAQAIVSIGGDGTMLHAIQQYWRTRLPFVGLNAGHRGFLLNDSLEAGSSYVAYQSPLLHVVMQRVDGTTFEGLAFNDAWVQCKPGTTGWMSLAINGEQKIPRLMGDGLLVATPAGSTAYARAMGANPLLIGTPSLLVVGSNIADPPGWKYAQIDLDSEVAVETEDDTLPPKKRPLYGFVDGVEIGEISSMEVRVSRVAAPELLFGSNRHIVHKVSELQFPSR